MADPRLTFFYDLASPEAYLASERSHEVLGVVPEWQPVLLSGLPAGGVGAFRCAEEESIFRSDIERRAANYGLMPMRWPKAFPADTEWAMLVAVYAKHIGRVVAYSQAAFRQSFAAGHDIGHRDTVLLSAASAEMHPAAVLKTADRPSNRARLEKATAAAVAAGVRDVPAVLVGDQVFHGDAELEAAAAALRAARA
jgi:2-hydroxychromene-2-carboxylate isomerase